jgi:hypothetical protein
MLPDVYGLETDRHAQRRPMGVTLIASLLGLGGFVVTLSGVARLIAWLTGRLEIPAVDGLTPGSLEYLIGFVLLLWTLTGLASLTICIGLLHLHRWAWIGCLILQGLFGGIQAVSALILVIRSGIEAAMPALLAGLLALAFIVYLLRPSIRSVFLSERRQARAGSE